MDTRWQALSYVYGLKLIVQLFVSANYRTNYQMKKILWTTLSFFNWKIVSTYLLTTHLLIRTAYFLHKLDNFSISRVGTQWYSLKMIFFFFWMTVWWWNLICGNFVNWGLLFILKSLLIQLIKESFTKYLYQPPTSWVVLNQVDWLINHYWLGKLNFQDKLIGDNFNTIGL